jgi:DNA-binding transcriptional ArsR family regulator
MSILSLLGPEQMTATGMARALGVHPANLTRHLRVLNRTGLIRLVEKRDTGRNLEKYYRASALAFEVRVKSDRIQDRRATALAILRDNLSTAVATARGDMSGDAVGLLAQTRIDPKQVPRLERRLRALVKEFAALDSSDGKPYCLSLALYPGEASTSPPRTLREIVIDPPPTTRSRDERAGRPHGGRVPPAR